MSGIAVDDSHMPVVLDRLAAPTARIPAPALITLQGVREADGGDRRYRQRIRRLRRGSVVLGALNALFWL